MENITQYRSNGAIGALLDEYEKAITELIAVIKDVETDDLFKIIDYDTEDEDCRSIQTILSHVVYAGYNYVVSIRKSLGEDIDYINKENLATANDYISALGRMFSFNEQLFTDHPNIKLEDYDQSKKIKVRWGQYYDVEQLIEHAIVHILRHRRQIERFKLRI